MSTVDSADKAGRVDGADRADSADRADRTAGAAAVVTVRPRRIRFFAGVLALVLFAGLVGAALRLRDTPTGAYFTVSDQIAMVGIGVLLACGALWITRPMARADAEGVDVRNMLGTTRYGWDAVRGISFPDGAAWARLEIADDEYVPVMAVQALDRDAAVAAIREFRGLHERYHSR